MTETDTISIEKATELFPKIDGQRPHAGTVRRWARQGISGVKLETIRVGGRVVTTRKAIERFMRSVAEA